MTKGLYLNKRAFKIGLTLLLVISTSFVFAISQKEKQQISFIKTGDLSRLISSIKKDADPNLLFTNGKSGLYYAIRYDHEEIARFLLEKGANPNLITEKTTLLEWAIKYNRRRTARYLIEYGADVNQLDNKLTAP